VPCELGEISISHQRPTTLARSARTRAPPLQKTRAAPLTPMSAVAHMSHDQPRAPGWDYAMHPRSTRAPEPAVEEPLERPALARPGGGSMAGGGRRGGAGGRQKGGDTPDIVPL